MSLEGEVFTKDEANVASRAADAVSSVVREESDKQVLSPYYLVAFAHLIAKLVKKL